jgi:hypothetical protein
VLWRVAESEIYCLSVCCSLRSCFVTLMLPRYLSLFVCKASFEICMMMVEGDGGVEELGKGKC